MIFGTTKATFFPHPCWQTWGRCNPPIDLPENGGFLEAGGRFFSEKTWKGCRIAKGGKGKARWEGCFNPQLWRNVVFWMPESIKQKKHFGKATESMEHTRILKFHHFPLSLFLPHFSSNIHHFLPILGMYLLFGKRGFPTIQTKHIKATHVFLPRACFLGHTVTLC